MWTKILNFFGFTSVKQIAEQHVSPYVDWKDEHREWMKAHDLKPLTFE